MSDSKKSVIIVGGGVAGLSAAKALDEKGIMVHLVEKTDHLGGKAFDWACMATQTCENCGACLAGKLADLVPKRDNIAVYTQTQLLGLTRNVSGFEAVLDGGFSGKLKADAVLMATGFSPFDPTCLTSLGYGQHQKVITTTDLNDLLKTDRISELIPEHTDPKIAFIQCVGSRNRKLDRNYCSQVCCKISLRHANKLLHLYPQADITVLHMDLQVIGKEFRSFVERLTGRVKLLQGVAAEIVSNRQEGKLTLFHEDEAIGVRSALHFDLIVLSVGMGMAEGTGELSLKLGIKPDPWGFLSQNESDFPGGIYATGSACGPMNILSAISQGQIVASRIADNLNIAVGPGKKFRIAIIGSGYEASCVSTELAKNGYSVVLIDDGIQEISENEHIKYLSNAKLLSAEGTVGNFILGIENEKGYHKEVVGAIVAATGTGKVRPGQDMNPERVTTMNNFMAYPEQKIPGKVAFWMDYSGPENKANAGKILDKAVALAEKGKIVHVLMEKMLVHGLDGQQKYDSARKAGVKFLRVADRAKARYDLEETQVKLTFEDTTLPGAQISVFCDILVIPERIVPPGNTADLAHVLIQAIDKEGFIQSPNLRHRPFASPRKGIFFAGSCHDETDENDLKHEISGILAGIGFLEKNGEPQGQPAQILENECIKCLTCFRVCPHNALILQSSNKPKIVPEACFECGLCVSNCPAKAIRQDNFSDTELVAGVKEGETVVFACERSAFLAQNEAKRLRLDLNEKVHIQPVRCTGRIGIENMLAPLLKGAARILVAGCHEGNCRSMESGLFAQRRISHTIAELGMDGSIINYYPVAANEPAKFKKITSDTK